MPLTMCRRTVDVDSPLDNARLWHGFERVIRMSGNGGRERGRIKVQASTVMVGREKGGKE